MPPDHPRSYFLGGYDLEMVTIRDWLQARGARVFDKRLAWGAQASAYRAEIVRELACGRTAVLVELEDDLGVTSGPGASQCYSVDHHGRRAGRDVPTALEQVFQLEAGAPDEWTRWMTLVAANDRGHLRALQEVAATQEEMRRIRAADRAAQGVTESEEVSAGVAVRQAQLLFDGQLTVVHLPHERTSAAVDALDALLGGPGFRNLLVFTPGSQSFYGEGRAVRRLDERFPGGYYGGELPERGFWGHSQRQEESALLELLRSVFPATVSSPDRVMN